MTCGTDIALIAAKTKKDLSEEQENSIDAQEKRIKELVAFKGYKLTEVIKDSCMSSGILNARAPPGISCA